VLKIRRDGETKEIVMNPVEAEDGNYKLGAWVRDDTQGIGTLTYLDTNGKFGALGHGISDSDTGKVVEIENGALYDTEILGIEKGSSGDPGVMAGVIFYGPGSRLGTIEANRETGIFGTAGEKLLKSVKGEPMEVGYRQDAHKGAAILRSGVSGTVKDYAIEIQRIEQNPFQKNKSMVIHITDPALLKETGGIIQGMSGSPIIQDGRLIGAVTHVFVQDATRGYGILLEDMLSSKD
jgi:stage IV sporulation protein B